MSPLLSLFRIPLLHRLLSNDNFRGSCFTLHAYVQVQFCHIFHFVLSRLQCLCYSSLNQGVSSHKKIPKEQSWILRQYYGNNIVLFLFCACNELFFVSIYLLSFPPPPNSPPRLGKNIESTKMHELTQIVRLYSRRSAFLSLPHRFHHVPSLCIQELDQCNTDGKCRQSPRRSGQRRQTEGWFGQCVPTQKINSREKEPY